MKIRILFPILIYFFSFQKSNAQDCDSFIGYELNDPAAVSLLNPLLGTVYNNPSDSVHAVICKPTLYRTSNSSGLMFMFIFLRAGEMIDNSVKVKIRDGATIFLSRSIYDTDNEAGIFGFIAGGDYGNKYELTLLRTKQIQKINISGNRIDSYTYSIDIKQSTDFMLGVSCLNELLK